MPDSATAVVEVSNSTQAPAAAVLSAAWLALVLRAGERYAGVVLNADGTPSHHLILLPGEARGVKWDAARAQAIEAGGDLPSRAEQSILFGNAKGEFESDWYWSDEQHAGDADYAWLQDFSNGTQDGYRKSYAGRARFVRRLVIE